MQYDDQSFCCGSQRGVAVAIARHLLCASGRAWFILRLVGRIHRLRCPLARACRSGRGCNGLRAWTRHHPIAFALLLSGFADHLVAHKRMGNAGAWHSRHAIHCPQPALCTLAGQTRVRISALGSHRLRLYLRLVYKLACDGFLTIVGSSITNKT